MTVKEFVDGVKAEYPAGLKNKRGEPIGDIAMQAAHVWSNDACSGYVVQAMKDAGFSETEIRRVQRALVRAYDEFTMGEAEKILSEWSREASTTPIGG